MENKIWDYKSGLDDKLSKLVQKDPDIAFTKIEMARHLISIVHFQHGDEVMEPCYGKGAFYDSLPNYTKNHWCEVNKGIDYLKQDKIVDITLSNPPFAPRKLFWEFHIKAMQTTRREIWWLINMSSLNVFTPNRIEKQDEMCWYLTKMHVVGDKRWFGRYVWCKFTRDKVNSILSYDKTVF